MLIHEFEDLLIDYIGFPGVGKTLTAESVALMAGKPLLSVGVSDIGIEGDKVEANLQKVFHLAGKWEAVLLLCVTGPTLSKYL
jgi:AAA+ superfamily predicted ATPase